MSIIQPSAVHLHIRTKLDQFHNHEIHHCSSGSFQLQQTESFVETICEVKLIELSETSETTNESEHKEQTPKFVNDHFTNLKDAQIGEISTSLLLSKTPWSQKLLLHSPFPKITKTTALHWIDHKNMVFLGWGENGALCKDFKIYSIHQSRNKINDDSINYRVQEVSKPVKGKSRAKSTGFYIDPQYLQTGIPSWENYLYVFDEHSLKWEEHFKVQGIKPPATIGSSVVNFELDGQEMLYQFGGETRNSSGTNDLWCYNLSLRGQDVLNRWRCITVPEAQRPPKLHNHCMINKGDYLLLFGGQFLNSNKLSNQLWGFNLISEHWFQIPLIGELPHLQNCKMTTGVNNTLFIYGGCDIKGETNETLYICNLKSHHVYFLPTNLKDSPGKRNGFEMCFDYELKKLIIIGGDIVEHKDDLIHDCNEIVYTHVNELNWCLLKEFAQPV